MPDAMRRLLPRTIVTVAVLVLGMSARAADSPQQAFSRQWERQAVVVKRPLYTLVFNERGKLGNTYEGRREGLTVVTPADGVYFQFDARQGRTDVVKPRIEEIIQAVRAEYEPDSLEVRSYRKVDPVIVHRFDAGVELVVRGVRVGTDTVRVSLALPDGVDAGGEVTSLTIKWPTPLSRTFSEREVVEGLMRWFVDAKPSS